MNAQYRHVSTDQGLAHEGRQHRGVVADVDLALRNYPPTHDGGDTLQYVVLVPDEFPKGNEWVVSHGRDAGWPVLRRDGATREPRKDST
jgi:hypothetical protein